MTRQHPSAGHSPPLPVFRDTAGPRLGVVFGIIALLVSSSALRGQVAAHQIDDSLARAAAFLAKAQATDGAWRSPTYGSFRDDPALTPHVLSALHFFPGGRDASARGVGFLLALDPDGAALHFPVYTAAETSWVVAFDGSERGRAVQRTWTAYLRARQLNASLGWTSDDPEFGGWGYSVGVPRKPAPGEPRPPLCESNLSSTLFVVGALRLAGATPDDSSVLDALAFVRRCQNLSDDPARADARFDDGGFFFIPNDAAKNKAGVAGADHSGASRFASYGSMTADGLRALLACGLSRDDPRVRAARAWLVKHFDPAHNPGAFAADREVLRDAYYFYYAWSVAHAMTRLEAREIDWAAPLSRELIARQRADGSWRNDFKDAKEDEPLVATPFAASALELCRRALAR